MIKLKFQHHLYVRADNHELIADGLLAEFRQRNADKILEFDRLVDVEQKAVKARIGLLKELKDEFDVDITENHPELLL